MPPVYTLKIAGPAGTGIKSTGLVISQLLANHGFYLKDYSEYPSLIRGGHNTYQVSFSPREIYAPHFLVDVFFSLEPGHSQSHLSEFTSKTLVFGEDTSQLLPLKQLSQQLGSSLYANTICLGVIAFLFNFDLAICRHLLTDRFGSDSPNLAAFKLGYQYAADNFSHKIFKLPPKSHFLNSKSHIYDGNESYGWGFIQGGGNFYAAYPMTPATGALHFLANHQSKYNLTVVHPEDEIAAAAMATGAAFAGARAAVGTSGGGFALMNEHVSFNGIAEQAVVYYLVSRPGPATGMPTWTSQADLLYAVNSGHGEFPKVVLAPSDQYQSFELSAIALNLAAQLQTPVIVISDKMISESAANLPDLSKIKIKIKKIDSVASPDSDFKRYLLTPSGVSPASLPGTPGGEYLSNSYEHDELGFAAEDADVAQKMMAKRLRKYKTAFNLLPKALFYGSDQADKLILSWGSPSATILEALKILDDPSFAFLQLRTLWPIDPNLKLLLKPFKNITVIENSATAQIVSLLKSQFDFNPTRLILKSDGRPFFPEELIKQFKKIK